MNENSDLNRKKRRLDVIWRNLRQALIILSSERRAFRPWVDSRRVRERFSGDRTFNISARTLPDLSTICVAQGLIWARFPPLSPVRSSLLPEKSQLDASRGGTQAHITEQRLVIEPRLHNSRWRRRARSEALIMRAWDLTTPLKNRTNRLKKFTQLSLWTR